MSSSESKPEPETQSDSLWGLATALGDWGLGRGSAEGDGSKEQAEEENLASDAELAAMTAELESKTAAAESVVASALWATVESLSVPEDSPKEQTEEENLASDAELAAMTAELESTTAAAETVVTSALRSTMESLSEVANSASEVKPDASSLWSMYTSNLKPAVWINQLEQEGKEKDPHKKLRDSLDTFIEAHPAGTYEEWVESLLEQEGWDEGSAVVDKTFYTEKSVHRNLWNERNYEDGIDVNSEDPLRTYVPVGAPKATGGRETYTPKKKVAPPAVSQPKSEEEEIIFDDGAILVPDTSNRPMKYAAGDLGDLAGDLDDLT